MLLIVNTVLGSCEYGNCFGSTFYSPVYCLYLYALLGTFNQNSPLPQSQCFRSAREDTNQSLSLTERSRVSVGILRQHFCEPFLRGGVSATFLPNDAAAAACRRRRRRSSSSSCVGGDARVPRWCSRRVRGPPPAGSCSAAPLGTLMHILYQPFQLNPTCIGTACADPSNIRSLSLTERPDVSVGILRHHSAAPLGQSLNIIYLP